MNFKHLIVDGWNVIHAAPDLRRLLDVSVESARAELLIKLSPIHDWLGARVSIVYDGKGDEISIERPNPEIKTFSEVFTPSVLTADELIEQLCANSPTPSDIAVATRDNMLRLTVSSFGAFAFVPDELWEIGKSAGRGVSRSAALNSRKVDGAWRAGRAHDTFEALDTLFAEIRSASGVAPSLISKHLKKRLLRDKDKSEPSACDSAKDCARTSKQNIERDAVRNVSTRQVSKESEVKGKPVKKKQEALPAKSLKSFEDIFVRGSKIEIKSREVKYAKRKKRNR